MDTITIPKSEYNNLVYKSKLLDDSNFFKIIEITKDENFVAKLFLLNQYFHNISGKIETSNLKNIYTITGKSLTKDEFRNEIEKTRKEIESGEFTTFENFVTEMNYD